MHVIIDGTTTQDQMAYAGPGQYTKNVILSLVRGYPNTKFSLLLFKNHESTLDGQIENLKNVEIVNIGKYRINDYKNDIWYFTKVLPQVRKIREEDSIFFSPYFWRNYPSYSMPTVLFVHDMNLPMFNMYSQISLIHNLIRGVQYWMTMYKSLKCKYLLCNSETTKNDYMRYFPKYPAKNMYVTYLGVDLEEKEVSLENVLPSDYKERGYIIYLGGGINKSKNSIGVIEGYISFLKMLKKEYSKCPYLVISGGKFQDKTKKEVQELYELIEREHIQNNVLFTGFYEDIQKYSLLTNAFAFIHLSMYEGFGFAPIESLRCKTPAILHKSPVYEELFSEVGLMVNGLDADEVGRKIHDVYTNPQKYKNRVEKGYQLSLKYTWEEVGKRTYDVFKKV
jgi:glycosyltransferase involved in cell wall biosynthesis